MEIEFDDEVRALVLLSSQPDSWNATVTEVSSSSGNSKLKFDDVRDLVLSEEIRRRESGETRHLQKARSPRPALGPARPERPKPGPSLLKGGPGRGLHLWPGPARWAGQNHGLLGPPKSPLKSPPRGLPKSPPKGPPRSPFRSPLRGPPKSPSKSPFIGPPRSPSKSPLKSPPKSPTLPCRFFI